VTDLPYTIGDVNSVFTALIIGIMSIMGLTPNIQALVKGKVVAKPIFDVIERKPEIGDYGKCLEDFTVNQAIKFRGVTFKYPLASEKIRNVLERVNFDIKSGETTAIVGPSGSGKSTIIQMIERFYEPKEGEIFFDDVSLKDIKIKTLRENIGYVSQEPVLIIGTIRENLKFGNKDASDIEIEEAIRKANATFIYDMEKKLDTYIGSPAVLNLSGGQKQRIAIARALLKKPKILILDEATSALDPKSEKEVQDAIDAIAAKDTNLTIITIAHRLQTISAAKNLLFLESRDSVVGATKGTAEYERIMNKLKEDTYAHQDKEEEQKEIEKPKEDIEILNHASAG
jgi:ATP-binding cassette, subfamily B (MDR/TAP), member 1